MVKRKTSVACAKVIERHPQPILFSEKARAAAKAKRMVTRDDEWQGDDFVKQSDALARG